MRKRAPGAVFGDLGAELLADPLAFLSAEHVRQGVLLGHLERLARHPQARGARALASALAASLVQDLPRHVAQEERSLHARLATHDPTGLLPRLRHEHAAVRAAVMPVLEGLQAIAAHRVPGADFPGLAQRFVAAYRAHLAIEEAEVLPLARRVLTPEALDAIAAELAKQWS